MRVLVQRVQKASVTVNQKTVSKIDNGLLVFVGIEDEDGPDDIKWLSNKIAGLRIFDDEEGVMNLSVKDIKGDILAVSQFTLHARVKKGFRPSYTDSAAPEKAIPVYESFIASLEKEINKQVARGIFGAEMQINLINDGPVTIWIDSKNKR